MYQGFHNTLYFCTKFMLYSESGARFGCNKGSKDDTDAWWVLEHN